MYQVFRCIVFCVLSAYSLGDEFSNVSDPSAVFYGGKYYIVASTSGAKSSNSKFEIYESQNLTALTSIGFAIDFKTLNNNYTFANLLIFQHHDFAHPVIQVVSGQLFELTFEVKTNLKTWVLSATALSIPGPYEVSKQPLHKCKRGEINDTTTFRDIINSYLVYEKQASFYIQNLDPDQKAELKLNTEIGGWEAEHIESPWLIRRGSYFYLFYTGFSSENCLNKAVLVARSPTLTGTWSTLGKPVVEDDSYGPHHSSVVLNTQNGDYTIFYNIYTPDCFDLEKTLVVKSLYWDRGDWPTLEKQATTPPQPTARTADTLMATTTTNDIIAVVAAVPTQAADTTAITGEDAFMETTVVAAIAAPTPADVTIVVVDAINPGADTTFASLEPSCAISFRKGCPISGLPLMESIVFLCMCVSSLV